MNANRETSTRQAGEPKALPRAQRLSRSARYEQLLMSARSVVKRGGMDALTISSLTEAAGVSRPVVYEHFKNSEDVAVALLEDYFGKIVALVHERTKGAETLGEYLRRAIEAEFEYHSDDSLAVRNLTNGHATGERLNKAFIALRRNTNETFTELLVQQGAEPEVARVGGYALAELIPNVVYEFASKKVADTARETLCAMVMGAVSALVGDAENKPVTPAKVLKASRRKSKLQA